MNNSTGITEGDLTCRGDVTLDSPAYVVTIFCLTLVNTVALCTNIFLIITIFSVNKLREKLTSLFIANLCTLDLFAAVTVMPKSIAVFISKHWLWNSQMCVVNGFLNTFLSLASIFAISCVSVERYYSITLPMHHAGNLTFTKTGMWLIMTWIVPVIISSLPVVGWSRYRYSNTSCHCTFVPDDIGSTALICATGLFFFLIPTAMFGYLNVGIYKVARRAALQVQPLETIGEIIPGCAQKTSGPCDGETTGQQRPSDATPGSPRQARTVFRTSTGQHSFQKAALQQTVTGISKIRKGASIDSSIRQCVVFEVNTGNSSKPNTVMAEQTVIFQTGGNGNLTTTSRRQGVSVTQIGQAQFVTTDTGITSDFSDRNGGRINMKALRTLVTTFILFLILWGPYFIIQFVNAVVGPEIRLGKSDHVSLWLSYVSYATNPYVYGLLNKTLRTESKIFIRKFLCKENTETNIITVNSANEDATQTNGAEDFLQFLERTSSTPNVRKF